MKDTRKNILLISRTLFNEQGYSNVTIRMIALNLKISSGNLNYHFKKREDILEALYFEMVEEFDERIKHLEKREITLKTVIEDINSSLTRMLDYRFFWTDLYNLLRLNKKIKSHFELAYKNRFKGYLYLFEILKNKEVMKDFDFQVESEHLIDRMIGFSNTWLYNSFLYEKKITKKTVELQSEMLLFMLYPYLTEFGKNEFQNVVSGSIS